MGGKRSPIRSKAPRWRPGRYKGRGRSKLYGRPEPFRPVQDTLIAIGASLVAGAIVVCLAVPLAATYRIPVFGSFGVLMSLLAIMTYRLGRKGQAGRVMTAAMAAVCLLGFGLLVLTRDQLQFAPRHHDHPAAAGQARP